VDNPVVWATSTCGVLMHTSKMQMDAQADALIKSTPKMADLRATINAAFDQEQLKIKQAVIVQELEAAQAIIASEIAGLSLATSKEESAAWSILDRDVKHALTGLRRVG
jgi:hypothetical protein